MDYMSEAKKFFSKEGFAIDTLGIEIEKAEPEHAVCSLAVQESHKNSVGVVMGGVIYSLADFAFAVACNIGQPLTVTLEGHITYLRPADCRRLTAETQWEKSGGRICSCRVLVTDENGQLTATAHFTGFRESKKG